ncbi:transposase [Anaeromyxobacter sp. Red801]|uniref:transposase n=1 Tax=Anaeromyxobacter sp. Red801 TaxID=3411632 RepID=UPI003BA249E5
MTAPRQILSGVTYHVTRRCAQRELLLRPSELVNETFLYVLGVALRRYGLLLHGFCVLSNHFHLVVTDPGAHLPAFEQYLDSLVARSLNAALGRWEAFWASGSYSAVALATPDDVVDRLAYSLANPVAAGLVQRAAEWPGLWSSPERIGAGPIAARRPEHFFRRNGSMPESVELELTLPPGFDDVQQFRDRLVEAIGHREHLAAERLKAEGRSFLGVRRVLAQSPNARPATVAPRRGPKPRVGARDKWKRIEALGRLRSFLDDYREALKALRAGLRDVVFPSGTYWLRVAHGVRCAPG